MSVLDFFEADDRKVNDVQTLSEKIKQRRSQMLIHSYLYYVLDDPIVDDDTWQRWANELVNLQKEKHNIGFYDDMFRDWTGDTGAHLKFDNWVEKKAQMLLNKYRLSVVDVD